MKYVWRNANVKGWNENLAFISPKIATFAIMLTFYLTGGEITASLAIKVIGWTELMKNTILTMLSLCVQYTMELLASIDRMQVGNILTNFAYIFSVIPIIEFLLSYFVGHFLTLFMTLDKKEK